MIENKLPSRWQLKALGDVLDIQGGSQPAKSNFIYEPKDGYIQLLQIRDFGKKGHPTFVPDNLVTKFCKKDDILIARYGASLGKILTGHEGAYNVALAKVIDEKGVFEKRYIYYLLKTQLFQMPLALLSRSAQNGFSKGEIAGIELPIPPLVEQKLIVSKIEELLSDLENGEKQLQIAQQQLKVYRQSLLNTIVTDKNVQSIESVIEKLDQGWSPRCLNEDSKDNDEWAVIKTTAVQHGHFIPIENKILPSGLKPRVQHELKVGDILITRAGPRIRVGVCCMVRATRPKLINCDKVYRIKVNVKIIKPGYFELILNTPYYLRELEKMKSGISDSGLNLTQSKFLKIEIPIPSIEEQLFIINELESKLTICDKIEETINQSLQQSKTLRQSILKKAFEGKLV